MNRLKIGVRLESLGLPLRTALQEAERLGVTGVRVDAAGDLAPQNLSQTGRRAFRHLLRAHNLELTALGCPLRRGLDTAENQEPRLEHVKRVLTLSFDLGPRVAVVQAGRVPDKPDDPRAGLLTEALRALGSHGDLDWLLFVSVLEEIDYSGWVTVERESGDNRLADVEAGVSFLRRFIGPAGP